MWEICACLIKFAIELVRDVFMDVIYEYPGLTVHLTLFTAIIAEGELYKMEHNEIQRIKLSEIPNYDFCATDEEILLDIQGRTRNYGSK